MKFNLYVSFCRFINNPTGLRKKLQKNLELVVIKMTTLFLLLKCQQSLFPIYLVVRLRFDAAPLRRYANQFFKPEFEFGAIQIIRDTLGWGRGQESVT